MNVDRIDAPDLLVLCGGQGTRLRSVLSDRPKSLAMIKERPFIEFVIAPFLKQGIGRVILCTGHLGHQLEEWYANRPCTFELIFSREHTPLGTAGALRHASPLITSDTVVVANGDSVCAVDLRKLLARHAETKSRATLTLIKADHRRDTGSVTMDAQHRITAFREKGADRSGGYHNAGIYVFDRSAIELIPAVKPCSLEIDWLPTLIPSGVSGFVSHGPLHDIGTPERLAEFLAGSCSTDSTRENRFSHSGGDRCARARG
ncbi:MAG: NTP transferase domain-containing protein [Nitrospira sp.]